MVLFPDPIPLMEAEVACPTCGAVLTVPVRLTLASTFDPASVDGASVWADIQHVRDHLAGHEETP